MLAYGLELPEATFARTGALRAHEECHRMPVAYPHDVSLLVMERSMITTRATFPLPFAVILLSVSTVSAAEHTTDSLDTVKKNLAAKKAVIVDVREKKEWDDGHLEDALHAPLSELKMPDSAKRFVSRLPENKIVYTHCAAGVRSVAAAKILRTHGVEVRPLKPGYDKLIEAGFTKAED